MVGQVFAYAAALWGMDLDELDRRFEMRKKISLSDAVRTAAEDDPDWDESSFRNAVAENLTTGRFRLVLAVDAITPELKHIVEYLNEHTLAEVSVLALELAYFRSEGVEVLQPRIYGQESATRKRLADDAPQWDEERFLAALADDDASREITRAVLAWVADHGLRVWYGHGRLQGSLYPIIDFGDRWYPLFGLWTSGRVELEFGTLKSRPPFDRREVRLEFIRRLEAIPGVQIPVSRADVHPSFAMALLSDEAARTTLFEVLEWAIAEIVPQARRADTACTTCACPAR